MAKFNFTYKIQTLTQQNKMYEKAHGNVLLHSNVQNIFHERALFTFPRIC